MVQRFSDFVRVGRPGRLFSGVVMAWLLTATGCQSGADRASEPPAPIAAAYLVEAQRALRQADFASALALTDSATQHVTTNQATFQADIHFLRGRVFSEARRYDEAEAAYHEALALNPDVRGVWFNLGNNAFRQQQYREAVGYYQREQAAYPTPTVLVNLGRVYAELGVADSAQWAYEKAIATDAAQPHAYARLSQLYEEEGRFEEALQQAQHALKRDPENLNYRYLVGALLLQTGQLEAAIEYLRPVAEQLPQHAAAQYNLGQALSRLGRTDEAQRFLAAADSARALEDDVARWTSLVEVSPNEPARWATLAYALRRAGRFDEAARAYTSALSLDPEHLEIRSQLADLESERGDSEAAQAHYRFILQRRPESAEAWLGLGVALAQQNQFEEAKEAWQTVLRYAPDHTEAKAYLARLNEPS